MKISEILKRRSGGISFEFFPPKTAGGKDNFMKIVKELSAFDPLYASVSYGAGGTTREGTFRALQWLKEGTNLVLMSHLTSIGSTKSEMHALLRYLKKMGIDNILALRGDEPKNAPDFDPARGEFSHAGDLVEFIRKYRHFSVAVAVYPEGHCQSPSIEKDMEYTKLKIDAGADFAITQMFFDNRYFYEFRERAAKLGITVPILPGIMPIFDCRRIVQFAQVCSANIPRDIMNRMEPVADMPDETRKLAIECATRQCEDLMKNGVSCLHFYTMNRSDLVAAILNNIGMRPKIGGKAS